MTEKGHWCKCYDFKTTGACSHVPSVVDVGQRSSVEGEDSKSLLRPPSKTFQGKGCYCKPGSCMAPTIMGKQMPCLDPEKAAMICKTI